MFPSKFALKPPARPVKRALDLSERVAIFKAVRDRGSSPESLAAAFRCSVATVLKISNLVISELEDVPVIRPTSDRDLGGAP